MSYDPYGDYQGDLGGVSEDDIIRMLISMGMGGGQTPGSTPSNRLSYLKSFTDFTGAPIEALFGMNAPQEPAAPFTSTTRQVYGNNPTYAAMFDIIDQGGDPLTAVENIGMKRSEYGDNASYDDAYKAAVSYATEKAEYSNKAREAQAKQVDYGFQNEYDLMGRPGEEDLVRQIAASRTLRQPKAADVGMGGADRFKAPPLTELQNVQAHRAAQQRIARAKSTNVRSDANQQLVNKILAIKTMLGD